MNKVSEDTHIECKYGGETKWISVEEVQDLMKSIDEGLKFYYQTYQSLTLLALLERTKEVLHDLSLLC